MQYFLDKFENITEEQSILNNLELLLTFSRENIYPFQMGINGRNTKCLEEYLIKGEPRAKIKKVFWQDKGLVIVMENDEIRRNF